jgi:hypothetical protein
VSLSTRLDRLAPALSAKERVLLVLDAWKQDVAEDPAWRSTMPVWQYAEFSRLTDLMNGANVRLGVFIGHVVRSVEVVEVRRAWLISCILWMEHIQEIDQEVRTVFKGSLRKPEIRSLLATVAWAPPPKAGEQHALDRLLDGLKESTCAQTALCWLELRCAELVLDEVAAELGVDPLKPKKRAELEDGKRRLLQVVEHLAHLNIELVLPEPQPQHLEDIRELVAMGGL